MTSASMLRQERFGIQFKRNRANSEYFKDHHPELLPWHVGCAVHHGSAVLVCLLVRVKTKATRLWLVNIPGDLVIRYRVWLVVLFLHVLALLGMLSTLAGVWVLGG